MKRWFLAGCILVVLVVASVYIFIPWHLVVNNIVLVQCNADGADRVLRDTGSWKRWWPSGGGTREGDAAGGRMEGGAAGSEAGGLEFAGVGYRVSQQLRRGVRIIMDDGGRGINSMLTLFPLFRIDSSYIQWEWAQDAGWNPLKRIARYEEAKRLKGDMGVILDSLKRFVEDRKNLYGGDIVDASTKDSFLVETNRVVKGYPDTAAIYGAVKKLESFATARGGERTGYPMVNIDSLQDGQYRLKVAIPVDKHFQDKGDILFRKLVQVQGTFLITDVRGGSGAIRAAMRGIKNYIADYHRTVMALPFLSLITDRTLEPDSTKWLTRIYYPIYPIY